MRGSGPDLSALDRELEGELVGPGDGRYDEARRAWNLLVDQRPAAVVYAATPDDVAITLKVASSAGLQVAPQGTGHGVAARGDLADAILLRTDRLTSVSVDPATRSGRFEAGAIWRDALAAAGEHGLAGPAGSSPDVGVAGYVTGGGFGWLSRRYGLACNLVTAFELVTADGDRRRVDAESEPELFWALRGGGGSYGVITAVEFELVELAEVFAGTVIYAADDKTAEIVHGYADWAAGLPDEVTSIVRFLQLPPMPQIPEPLRGRSLVTIGACHAGDPAAGEELIAPARSLSKPIVDGFAAMPAQQLVTIHMDPEEPLPSLTHHALLGELPAEAVDAFIEVAGPESGSPLTGAELRHAGGALGRPAENAGALSHLDAAFVFNGVGAAMNPEMAAPVTQHLDRVRDALGPWASDRCFANFSDRPAAAEELYDDATLERLRAVKREYDPGDVIRGAQQLGTA